MTIVGNTMFVYQAIEYSMKDVAHHVDVSVPITLNPDDSKAKAAKIIGKRVKLISRRWLELPHCVMTSLSEMPSAKACGIHHVAAARTRLSA